MKRYLQLGGFCLVFLVVALTLRSALPTRAVSPSQPAVLTQHNDNARTGANLRETILNTSNVNSKQFGKLFARQVDGQIYAQPLYVPQLTMSDKLSHNVVYVATQHNSVYAFEADNPDQTKPFWQVNLGPSAPALDFGKPGDGPYHDILIEVGITSTPVIDPMNQTIYVLALTKEGNNYIHRLHALDLVTGKEKFKGPVAIKATIPGNGIDSVDGQITFNSKQQLQRPALLLSKGVIYIAFGSYDDNPPYHGWLLGYDARTLKQVSVFNTTPNGEEASIWQSGQGVAADDMGNLYLEAANGTFSASTGGSDFGNSFIKLKPSSNALIVQDWFTPYNYAQLNDLDLEVGSTGVMLIPGTDLLVGGDKQGILYLLHRDNFGHLQTKSKEQITQALQVTEGGNIHGTPVFWNSPEFGPLIYVGGEHDPVKGFRLADGKLQLPPTTRTAGPTPKGMPGAIMSLSANGSEPGTGILWVSHPYYGDANKDTVPGILRALDASNLDRELWNSKQDEKADDVGFFAKFVPPTVVNGKVYMASFSNQLVVYGLKPIDH
jgi:hypothetical protein